MISLTAKQVECLEFMDRTERATKVFPSMQEISKHLGYSSKSRVYTLLQSMEERGVIRKMPGKARAYEIVSRKFDFLPPDVRSCVLKYAEAHDTSPETVIAERMREWAEHEARSAA